MNILKALLGQEKIDYLNNHLNPQNTSKLPGKQDKQYYTAVEFKLLKCFLLAEPLQVLNEIFKCNLVRAQTDYRAQTSLVNVKTMVFFSLAPLQNREIS